MKMLIYDEAIKNGDFTVDDFAPFSHDAQSGGSSVPDGGVTLGLLGLGLLGTKAICRSFE